MVNFGRGYMKFLFFTIPLLVACSSRERLEKEVIALETWKGRPVSELKTHSYFKVLRQRKIEHDEGVTDLIFRDQTRFQTSAYCDSLGGCMGLPTYNCDIAFSVKNDVILGATRNGSCPDPAIMKAK